MRRLCFVLVALAAGCATTVHRLDGEVPTRAGPARNACEKEAWLVIAPTRYQEPDEDGRTTSAHNDGLGLYQVGASQPESIPTHARELGDSPLVDQHVARVRAYDRQRLLSGLFAGAGLVTIGIGTGVFVSGFQSRHVIEDGVPTTRQHVDATRTIGGAVVAGVGLALGIAGLLIAPSSAERAEGDAARYAFQPPTDDRNAVRELVAARNQRVRDRCPAAASPEPATAPPPSSPPPPAPEPAPSPPSSEPDAAAPSGD